MSELEKNETSDVAKPKKRISWFAWFVTLIVACCLVVMNLRGELDPNSVQHVFDTNTKKFEVAYSHDHGWPIRCVESQPDKAPSGVKLTEHMAKHLRAKPNQSFEQGWLPNATSMKVEYRALSINVFVAVCILCLVFFACRFRSRRKQGFKFSLFEVGGTMLLVSVAMANYQYHRGISDKENRLIGETSGTIRAIEHKWHGYSMLRSLLGDAKWLSAYRHVDRFECDALEMDDSVARNLGDFAFASSVKINHDPTIAQIEALAQIRGLKSIEVDESYDKFKLLNARRRIGVTDNVRDVLRKRNARSNLHLPNKERSQQPSATFPSVTKLSINSTLGFENKWPRALDFVARCPNLREISLVGKQYIVDDLMELPASIERINFGGCAPEDGVEILRAKFPHAVVESEESGSVWKKRKNSDWRITEIRVNRRRSLGWQGSQFLQDQLDLSSTYVDREFLQKLNSVFPSTSSIMFGSFDSSETAIWLTKQCPKLNFLKTNGYPIEFSDAMQFPKSLRWLVIEQGTITADEFVELVRHLELGTLKIISSSFEDHEIEKIRAADRDCKVILR